MSLNRCNFCLYDGVRKHAEITGQRIKLVSRSIGSMHGVDVLVYRPDETPTRNEHFVCWFAALPDHCVCHID